MLPSLISSREIIRLFNWAHVHVRMLAQIVVERRTTSLRSSHNEEIWQSGIDRGAFRSWNGSASKRASRLGGGFHLLEFVNLNCWNMADTLKHLFPSCAQKNWALRLCEEEVVQR